MELGAFLWNILCSAIDGKVMLDRQHIGHGIGLRRQHFSRLLEEGPRGVDWFEIISEDYMVPGGRPWVVLERIRREVPVVLHGVSMGIGDSDPLSEAYLSDLEKLIERVEPAWVSDHLCWRAAGKHQTHELLPLPWTEESLVHVASRVKRVQERLRRPLFLENVSAYLAFVASHIPEHEFLNALVERTGCRILLDVNNVYVSAQNLGLDAECYIDEIDRDAVGHIHLAGHTSYERCIVDTHAGPVHEPVWQLYRRALRHCGAVPTLIEWDEDVPDYDRVVAESARAKQIEREVLFDCLEGSPSPLPENHHAA